MSTKDSAKLTMDSCAGREMEDQAVKRLFSRKDFLANIMKGTVVEYADLSIEEIMDCIEETQSNHYIQEHNKIDIIVLKNHFWVVFLNPDFFFVSFFNFFRILYFV